MTPQRKRYIETVKGYSTKGVRVRSTEGSAVGLSPARAADAKKLAREGTARAVRLFG